MPYFDPVFMCQSDMKLLMNMEHQIPYPLYVTHYYGSLTCSETLEFPQSSCCDGGSRVVYLISESSNS
ncbi:hypothetical protein Plhal304r1_c049g0131511 [Plasmopara halstedii]